jgi:hypothetical protein
MADDSSFRAHPIRIVAGGLMIAGAVLPFLFEPFLSTPLLSGSLLSSLLFAAALALLALGSTSVTARRPLGTAALLVLAAWVVVVAIVPQATFRGVGQPSAAELGAFRAFEYVDIGVRFLVGLVAVIQIARSDAVPRPWRWAPTWVLAAVTVTWLLQALAAATTRDGASAGVAVAAVLDGIARVGGVILLGVLAIALPDGSRTAPAAVTAQADARPEPSSP